MDKNCKDCAHIRYCRGGCPYNAIVPTDGKIKAVDPHCVAYKRIFDEIKERQNKDLLAGTSGLEGAMIGFDPMRMAAKPGVMAIMLKRI